VGRGERGDGASRKPPEKNLDPKQRGALDLGLVFMLYDLEATVHTAAFHGQTSGFGLDGSGCDLLGALPWYVPVQPTRAATESGLGF